MPRKHIITILCPLIAIRSHRNFIYIPEIGPKLTLLVKNRDFWSKMAIFGDFWYFSKFGEQPGKTLSIFE